MSEPTTELRHHPFENDSPWSQTENCDVNVYGTNSTGKLTHTLNLNPHSLALSGLLFQKHSNLPRLGASSKIPGSEGPF